VLNYHLEWAVLPLLMLSVALGCCQSASSTEPIPIRSLQIPAA
jgi:hypothetical protein